MSSVSWKGGESKGQEKKEKHKKRRAEGQPSWYEKTVDADFKEEEIHIPKDKVGLIFRKKRLEKKGHNHPKWNPGLSHQRRSCLHKRNRRTAHPCETDYRKGLACEFHIYIYPFYVIIYCAVCVMSFT